jgi:hypothetical protein
VGHHLYHRIHQKNDAQHRHEAAFGSFQQIDGKGQNILDDLFLAGKQIDYPGFKIFLETESLGNAECHGHDRHYGQQGVQSQGRCLKAAPVPDKFLDRNPENTISKIPVSAQDVFDIFAPFSAWQ